MRRLFIMRKDLHMSPGKLAAQVGHCAEVYWLNWIKDSIKEPSGIIYTLSGFVPKNIVDEYINGSITKTICEARNKNHLMKAVEWAESKGFYEGEDYGLIRDNCLTELEPEDEDGRTTTGIWFKPLPDDLVHEISKKYQLYR